MPSVQLNQLESKEYIDMMNINKMHRMLLGIIFFALVVFSYLSYRYVDGRSDFIKSYYSELPAPEKRIPDLIKDVISKVEQKSAGAIPESVLHYTASQIEQRYKQSGRATNWQFRNLFSSYIIESVLNDDQILALYCHFLPYEEGIGLTEASKFYFNKNLSDVTVEEVIALLVIGRSPGSYSPTKNPDRFRDMKAILFGRYSAQSDK